MHNADAETTLTGALHVLAMTHGICFGIVISSISDEDRRRQVIGVCQASLTFAGVASVPIITLVTT